MKTYLEPLEIERMEEAATCMRDRLLVRVLFRLGCRISEALALEVKDVDFVQGRVTILHLKSRIRLSCPHCGARLGKTHAFCPKCGTGIQKAITEAREHRRMRTLPLDNETLEMLKGYIDRGGPVSLDGKALIFGIGRGQGWRIIKECAQMAGVGKMVNPETGKVHNVSPHKLRDAFAINAVKVDDSTDGIRMLQQHLGHANIGTTMNYRKIAGEELSDWYGKLWEGKHARDDEPDREAEAVTEAIPT